MYINPEKKRISAVVMLALVMMVTISALLVTPTPVQAAYCGKLSSYTTWYMADYPKPILYVWKGIGSSNPSYVIVMYDNQAVSNTDDGIRTDSPQVDNNDGWVGYFLAKRWYLFHLGWDDDSRWFVSGYVQ
jgi:hypothetical protein